MRRTWWMLLGGAALVGMLAACGAPAAPAPAVLSVTIDQNAPVLWVGDSATLTATVQTVGGADAAVTWSSDDPGVATVGAATGVVTGVAEGGTTVRATSVVDPTVGGSVSVTVRPLPETRGNEPAPDSVPGDPFHAPLAWSGWTTPWTLAAPGLLANASSDAVIVSFGAGSLGGLVGDHLAGAAAEVDGHRLRVDADGAVEFAPAAGFTGLYGFHYLVADALGAAEARAVIAVGVRPSAGGDLAYPQVLIGNVGIDTARSTATTVPLSGDALNVAMTGSVGGVATFACAEGATACTFAFAPAAGFTGPAWFEAEASNGFGTVGPVRVALDVAERVWFVDAAAGPGGDGTLAAPFDCLRTVGCAANDVLAAGDAMFLAPARTAPSAGRPPSPTGSCRPAHGWSAPARAPRCPRCSGSTGPPTRRPRPRRAGRRRCSTPPGGSGTPPGPGSVSAATTPWRGSRSRA
jgi:hypothetical protein